MFQRFLARKHRKFDRPASVVRTFGLVFELRYEFVAHTFTNPTKTLSSKQAMKSMSSDKLTVPSEEKVFESVIGWVKHELGSKKCILPQLMENVRLPLTLKHYILKKVVEELFKNSFKCKDYIIEPLHFHIIFKTEELIPQNIGNNSRHGDKVIFVIGGEAMDIIGTNEIGKNSTEWLDTKMNRWNFGPEMITSRRGADLAVVNDNLVFAVGGFDDYDESLRSVDVLDLSSESPRWKPSVDMLVKRDFLGVGVINNNIYAVGGINYREGILNSAEVFDFKTQEWRLLSSMSTGRPFVGVGILNNLLYAVGGFNESSQALDTVECYHPNLDTWTPVAKMAVHRSGAGVGVLDGVLYAVGGCDGSKSLSSVEAYRPSTGVWTTVADMNIPRQLAGVVALNGLLYAVGGEDGTSFLGSTECYSPKTNTWTVLTASMNDQRTSVGVVVINKPRHFKNSFHS